MKTKEEIKILAEELEKKEFISFNTYFDRFEEYKEQIHEYLGDELDNLVNAINSNNQNNSKILKRYQSINWGGTSTYRILNDDYLVQINGTNKYILASVLESELDNFLLTDLNERANDISERDYGDNRLDNFDTEEIISDVILSRKEVDFLKKFIYIVDKNSKWEDIIVFDENRLILNSEEMKEEVLNEWYFSNKNIISKEELIKRLKNLKYYNNEEVEEFIYSIEEAL